MKTLSLLLTLFFVLGAVAIAADNQETAASWQEQATSTRAAVVSVAEELGTLNPESNPTAKGLVDDAVMWLGMGDKELAKGDAAMKEEQWDKANFGYNMAWQYYVKAATAGLNAKRILTGK